jgi:hypothetical protein
MKPFICFIGVECLPNEMFTPLNSQTIYLGQRLFHRGEAYSSGVSGKQKRNKFPAISACPAVPCSIPKDSLTG